MYQKIALICFLVYLSYHLPPGMLLVKLINHSINYVWPYWAFSTSLDMHSNYTRNVKLPNSVHNAWEFYMLDKWRQKLCWELCSNCRQFQCIVCVKILQLITRTLPHALKNMWPLEVWADGVGLRAVHWNWHLVLCMTDELLANLTYLNTVFRRRVYAVRWSNK